MFKLNVESCLKLIFILSLISIISAYFIEYILGHQPCNLCLLQRIPYVLALILVITNYIFKKNEKFILLLLILVFTFSFFISFYHFGIEQGFFKESTVCGLINAADVISKDELLKQLREKTVSCKDVTFRIFGLSLTSINIILSLIIIIILIRSYIIHEKNKL